MRSHHQQQQNQRTVGYLLGLLLVVSKVQSFVIYPQIVTGPSRTTTSSSFETKTTISREPARLDRPRTTGSLVVVYNENNNKKKSGLDGNVRTKLLSESIAPWRSLRLFLYISFASGALIGGLITLSGTAALLSGV